VRSLLGQALADAPLGMMPWGLGQQPVQVAFQVVRAVDVVRRINFVAQAVPEDRRLEQCAHLAQELASGSLVKGFGNRLQVVRATLALAARMRVVTRQTVADEHAWEIAAEDAADDFLALLFRDPERRRLTLAFPVEFFEPLLRLREALQRFLEQSLELLDLLAEFLATRTGSLVFAARRTHA